MGCKVIIVFLVLMQAALAGGRGGHNTIFDPNSYGGGWKDLITDFSATCNGPSGQTADSSARNAWVTYALANPTPMPKLRIRGNCWFDTNSSLWFDGVRGDPGVANSVVWAYGATINNGSAFGGFGFYDDQNHYAKVNTANVNDTSVTVITGADAAKFAVNDWVMVTGLSTQVSSFPPNFQFFEPHRITSIVGSVISLDTPLINQYLSTWPTLTNNCDSAPCGGPAAIYTMEPSWNINYQVFGGTWNRGGQINVIGRTAALVDVVFGNQGAPSTNQSAWFIFGDVNDPEVDKDIVSLNYVRTAGGQLIMQSAAVTALNMTSTNWRVAINGTAINTTFVNSVTPAFRPGPTCCGHGGSITLDGSYVGSALLNNHNVQASWFTFSSGTLSIANNDANINTVWGVGVPGQKYYWGDSDGTNNSAPLTYFTISAIRQDGTNTYWDLSACSWGACSGSLPTPTCNGHSCPEYVAYAAAVITQINNKAGSADLTQYAAPP